MKLAGSICLIGLLLSAPAHASVYYVTIAGLVGEPDYEQRFTASAKDLEKHSRPPAPTLTCRLTAAKRHAHVSPR
jgi:hypothetical protein